MKIGTVESGKGHILALIIDDKAFDLATCSKVLEGRLSNISALPDNMMDFLYLGLKAVDTAKEIKAFIEDKKEPSLLSPAYLGEVSQLKFKPPITNSRKLLCLAGNYLDHIEESGMIAVLKEETNPRVFLKPVSTGLIGPGDAIKIPKTWPAIDWEAELAVIIGKRGKYIPESEALQYVAGYTCFNDVSGRNLCLNGKRKERNGDWYYDWYHGKCMDTFASLGPWMVTEDEFVGLPDLRMSLRVNGVTKQDARTSDMLFRVHEIISFISQIMTLEPGDVIATGTPAGVGVSKDVPEFLKPGDQVDVEIEGIGLLTNPVIAE